MANYSRSLILTDGATFHVVWKCHNDDWLLHSEFAKQIYYDALLKYKDRYGILIYSYCFMANHPHITGRCRTQKELSDFFRVVNSVFAKNLNKELSRKGQVVMDRFHSPQIQHESDLLKVMFYIDLNPYRTVKRIIPNHFKWTSFHYYASGKPDPLLTPPDCYLELGKTFAERQARYRVMVREIIENESLQKRILKKNYSKTFFIGDPTWVRTKYKILKQCFSQKRKEWYQRFIHGGSLDLGKTFQ